MKEVEVRGEKFQLLPDGALFWPSEGILAVADYHLGKSETFGRSGFPLPAEAQWADLSRLNATLKISEARHLLFLGDLVHTLEGVDGALAERWISGLAGFQGTISLVSGNHDRRLIQDWPAAWERIQIFPELKMGSFAFRHEPPRPPESDREFVWAGHIHPCVRLSAGADRLRLKAFVLKKNHGILPAYSSLAGGHEIALDSKTRVYPIAEGKVYEWA